MPVKFIDTGIAGVTIVEPEIGIAWPIKKPLLSAKDADLARLNQIPPTHLPQYSRS